MRNLTPLEVHRIRGREVLDLWGWEGDEDLRRVSDPLVR